MIGDYDETRRVHGIAGLSGKGNCYADVGAEFLAGRVAGVESDIERRYGPLMERMFKPGRDAANWDAWKTTHEI